MKVMLRSDSNPDVVINVSAGTWEACSISELEQHIRTLQIAKTWLVNETEHKKNQLGATEK